MWTQLHLEKSKIYKKNKNKIKQKEKQPKPPRKQQQQNPQKKPTLKKTKTPHNVIEYYMVIFHVIEGEIHSDSKYMPVLSTSTSHTCIYVNT